MKKVILFWVVFWAFLLTLSLPARAQSTQAAYGEQLLKEQIQTLDLQEVETFIRQIDAEVGEYLPEISISKVLDDLRHGKLDLGLDSFLKGLMRFLFRELLAQSSLLGKLVILAVLCAVLQSLLVSFEKGTTGQLAYMVAYLVLITIALSSFKLAIDTGREAVDRMVTFVHALLPVLLTLLAAIGGMTTAALLHPFILISMGILSTLIKGVVFPLIYFAAILNLVSEISTRFKVSNLALLFRQICIGLLGLCLTLFIGLLSVQGVAGSVADSVTLRTAKFMTGTFVPVIGKLLSDAVEAVAGTSLLLKNAVGIVGAMTVLILSLFPVLKILALVMIYRVAAALVQPFGDAQIANSLEAMANNLIFVFAATAAVGLMFFTAISIIVGMGNVTVMLR
ncbi:stage III sporulation protein AE [Calderihabitans maritimus]|uniref:Stage III sporulation protein AE n=1 Tax=Calderihabitans maritimus TaxID=1246530 RepID=A0A1Z5HXU4_9FIRM|nr:stage III sporulation protein AE [Calderihabitans maritimus]GAW94161.1 hypothetical protein Dred_1060 [Calderihabitans maritimus]